MSNINELVFDIKLYIASFHSLAWYKLTRIDDEFREYSLTKEGMSLFVKLFYMWETHHNVKVRVGKWDERYVDTIKLGTLFGVVNSINDEPAEIIIEEIEQLPYITNRWYKNGLKHRDNYDGQNIQGDLPAEVEYYKSKEQKRWYKNGLTHRDGDLPAIILFDEKTRMWLKNDIICRDNDLPAYILNDKIYFWYIDGVRDRENDLPAVIHKNEHGEIISKEWYKNGKLHRDGDLPAAIFSNGTQQWFKNGKRYRDNDLPTIVHADGTEEWYDENGIRVR